MGWEFPLVWPVPTVASSSVLFIVHLLLSVNAGVLCSFAGFGNLRYAAQIQPMEPSDLAHGHKASAVGGLCSSHFPMLWWEWAPAVGTVFMPVGRSTSYRCFLHVVVGKNGSGWVLAPICLSSSDPNWVTLVCSLQRLLSAVLLYPLSFLPIFYSSFILNSLPPSSDLGWEVPPLLFLKSFLLSPVFSFPFPIWLAMIAWDTEVSSQSYSLLLANTDILLGNDRDCS